MPRNNQCIVKNAYNDKPCQSNVMTKNKLYNMQICYFHNNYLFAGPAKCIQNIYRNNKIREAINIYKNLPQDLQGKILFHMRENDLVKKHHHDVIEKIIIKRCANLTDKRNNIYNFRTPIPIYIKSILSRSNDIFNLLMKYKEILSYRTHHLLSIEIGRLDEYLLHINVNEYMGDDVSMTDSIKAGLENALTETTDNLIKTCIDINKSKLNCKLNNKKTNNWHQLYADNINLYQYYT